MSGRRLHTLSSVRSLRIDTRSTTNPAGLHSVHRAWFVLSQSVLLIENRLDAPRPQTCRYEAMRPWILRSRANAKRELRRIILMLRFRILVNQRVRLRASCTMSRLFQRFALPRLPQTDTTSTGFLFCNTRDQEKKGGASTATTEERPIVGS